MSAVPFSPRPVGEWFRSHRIEFAIAERSDANATSLNPCQSTWRLRGAIGLPPSVNSRRSAELYCIDRSWFTIEEEDSEETDPLPCSCWRLARVGWWAVLGPGCSAI